MTEEVMKSSDLCLGIASTKGSLAVAAVEAGRPVVELSFPAGRMGVEAIKGFLADYRHPVRLAVAGGAALGVALALGDGPGRETFIVSSATAGEPVALAHFAGRAI